MGSHPATAQWMQRPARTKCWCNNQSPTKNIRVPKYWLTKLMLTLTLMLATVRDHGCQRLRFLGVGGWLTLLCALNPDKIKSDESGRWFKVTDKYPSDRCVPRSVRKGLKEVGQSSRERKKWLIMLWYVVFSETAEKMKKDWKRRKICQETTDVICVIF